MQISNIDEIKSNLTTDFSEFENPTTNEKLEEIKSKIASGIKQSGEKANQSQDIKESASQHFSKLGIKEISDAASEYISESLENKTKKATEDSFESNNSFINKTKINFFTNFKNSIKSFFSDLIKGKVSQENEDKQLLSKKANEFSV
ncbi:MAG: hypothetical protein ACJAVG_001270, partial [Rickettsiales bacterium]